MELKFIQSWVSVPCTWVLAVLESCLGKNLQVTQRGSSQAERMATPRTERAREECSPLDSHPPKKTPSAALQRWEVPQLVVKTVAFPGSLLKFPGTLGNQGGGPEPGPQAALGGRMELQIMGQG